MSFLKSTSASSVSLQALLASPARSASAVADLALVFVDPCIFRMWEHLPFEIGVDFIGQRHVLGIPQRAIRLWLAFVLALGPQYPLSGIVLLIRDVIATCATVCGAVALGRK